MPKARLSQNWMDHKRLPGDWGGVPLPICFRGYLAPSLIPLSDSRDSGYRDSGRDNKIKISTSPSRLETETLKI